jgi:hypothetical protein
MSSPLSDTGKQMAIASAAASAAVLAAEEESSDKMRAIAREEVLAHRLTCIEGPMGEVKKSLASLTTDLALWKVEVQTEIRAASKWLKIIGTLIVLLIPALLIAARAWVSSPEKHSSVDLISSAHAAGGTQDGGTP